MNRAKQLAIDVAKKMAQEPLEILKNAEETILSSQSQEIQKRMDGQVEQRSQVAAGNPEGGMKKEKELRTMQALENEIRDIRINRTIEEIQKKISLGESVYFENYLELPPEQIEILKTQKEEMDKKRIYEAQMSGRGAIKSGSKRGRRFGSSKKQVSDRESTRTENPTPPSG